MAKFGIGQAVRRVEDQRFLTGAGRYVDVADFGKFPPASVTIDFNNAYNPNCARSAFFTSPSVLVANATKAVKVSQACHQEVGHRRHSYHAGVTRR